MRAINAISIDLISDLLFKAIYDILFDSLSLSDCLNLLYDSKGHLIFVILAFKRL